MTVREVNLEEVKRRRDRLFERFGEAPVREHHESPSPDRFEAWIEMSESGYVGSAYALVWRPPEKLPPLSETVEVDGEERERVLLILPRGGSRWGIPGGGQEGDETYEQTVRREVREEVGIDATPTELGSLRHDVATCEGFEERLHVLRAFFLASYDSGSISIQPGELNGAAWFAEAPAEDRLLPSTERLLDRRNGRRGSD